MLAFKKIAVIGAGIGGLATAIRLANQGASVHVFEANHYAGGKVSEFWQAGFRFDAGPSLFTLPELLDDLFVTCGKNPADYYQYHQLDIITRYFYPDGTDLTAFSDLQKLAKELEHKTGEQASKVIRFLKKSETLYQLTSELFLFNSMHKLDTFLNKNALKTLFQLRKLNALQTMHQANKAFFKSPKLVQLFDRYATYNGSDPYQAPATLNVIPHLEFNKGAYFLKGGIHSITKSLVKLAEELGVQFHFNSPVERIIVENTCANGVVVKGKKWYSDAVVSNMDVVHTYRKLMPNETHPNTTLNQPRSTSALIFYWGIDKLFPQLDLHNIFFSADYKAEFDYLSHKKDIYHDPTVYVHISSKHEKNDAPKGKENWFVMVNAPHLAGQNWDALIQRVRQNILDKLSAMLGEDIGSLISCESILTPSDIESRTSSYLGALYGSSSNNRMAAFLRHPNFSRRIKDLYFCGGSVHPGGGIPLCLASAKIIERCFNSKA